MDSESEHVETVAGLVMEHSIVFLLGLFGWHVLVSFQYVEWQLLRRQLNFKWVHVPYLLSRYTLLVALITIVIVTRTGASVNCQAAYKTISIFGTISVACASSNLSVRTFTLWRRNRFVQLLLVALTLGQWCGTVILALTSIAAHRTGSSCSSVYTSSHTELALLYSITVLYDLLIMLFTVAGLLLLSHAGSSALWGKLMWHGMGYFATSLIVNLLVVIMAMLNLSPIMNLIFTIPAVTISVVASSLFVISLTQHAHDGSTRLSSSRSSRGRRPREPQLTTRSAPEEGKAGQLTTNINLCPSACRDSSEILDERPSSQEFPRPIALRLTLTPLASASGRGGDGAKDEGTRGFAC